MFFLTNFELSHAIALFSSRFSYFFVQLLCFGSSPNFFRTVMNEFVNTEVIEGRPSIYSQLKTVRYDGNVRTSANTVQHGYCFLQPKPQYVNTTTRVGSDDKSMTVIYDAGVITVTESTHRTSNDRRKCGARFSVKGGAFTKPYYKSR